MPGSCSQLAKSMVEHAPDLGWEVVVGRELAVPDIVYELHKHMLVSPPSHVLGWGLDDLPAWQRSMQTPGQ